MARILLITDWKVNPEPWRLFGDLPGGAVILIRDYDHPEREAYARRTAYNAHARGMKVLVAGDMALARRIGADGLHVPEWQLARLPKRIFAKPGFLITAATHSKTALLRAERHGLVDAALLSPVFATKSHPNAKPLGATRFSGLARAAKLPVLALGGVKMADFRRLQCAGASGFCLLSSWLSAERPVLRRFVSFMQQRFQKAGFLAA